MPDEHGPLMQRGEAAKPRISLISLGGTISAVPDEAGLNRPSLTGARLLEAVPRARAFADVVSVPAATVGGHALTLGNLSSLAHLVRREVDSGADGVVITQGTDTLEETAYALALQLGVSIPIVLTGAMRAAEDPGADGPANLLSALRVASEPNGLVGPIVVIQDEVHAARWVTKLHTSRIAAFGSPGGAPIGEIVEDRVVVTGENPSEFLGLPSELSHRIHLLWTAVGLDGTMVEAASAADGLVVAGMGGGHVPPAMASVLERLVSEGLPVVLASRCLTGQVLTRTYAGEGTESALLAAGIIPGGRLSPLKTRLRLAVALALGVPASEVFPIN